MPPDSNMWAALMTTHLHNNIIRLFEGFFKAWTKLFYCPSFRTLAMISFNQDKERSCLFPKKHFYKKKGSIVMTRLFLGIFDMMVSLFLWIPLFFVCLTMITALKNLFRRKFTFRNLALFVLSAIYISVFVYFYIYKPSFLAPIFCMVTCLVPVAQSSMKLMRQ